MKKISTLCLIVMLYSIGILNAQTITKVGCVSDDNGNRYSLTATTNSNNRVVWNILGTSVLAVDSGVEWYTSGIYDTVTKKLTITLINPKPDNCDQYNDSVHVVLRYTGNSPSPVNSRNGKGNFYNYCAGDISGDNSITAAAVPGSCSGPAPLPIAGGGAAPRMFGGAGSTSSLPPQIVALPEGGMDLNDILRDKNTVIDISPNPAVSRAQIAMSTNEPSLVDIRIYDQFGRLIRVMSSSTLDAGSYTFNWDLSSSTGVPVISGIYLVVVKIGDNVTTKRVSVVK